DRVAHPGAEDAGDRLAADREPENGGERDDHPRLVAVEMVRDQRAQLQAEQRTTEEPDVRQQTDQEPLSVTVDGEQHYQKDEDDIDHAAGHLISVLSSR